MTREELKQADTKKLISALQYCGRDSYYATYYDEVVDEITQRLERIEELEAQIEKMKCCENCKYNRPVTTVNETIGNNCEYFFNGCNNNSLLGLLNWELRK